MADAARDTVAWLYRRAGWGLAPGELDARAADGVAANVDRLVDPDSYGIPPSPDPWAGVNLTLPVAKKNLSTADKHAETKELQRQASDAINAWLDHLIATQRPLEDWMAWFWHGHFVSGLDKVPFPSLLVQQLRTFRSLAFAPFPQLVRAAAIDPAMLIYLDGDSSTGSQPNENFGRELLELFTLGIGNYTELDVQSGARALTGWTVQRSTGKSRFVPSRHDATPQRYLSQDGVHDVDTVVQAVTSNPACPAFIAGKLATAILGPNLGPSLITQFAQVFVQSKLDTRALVRAILQAGAQGNALTAVNQPVPWLVAAQRATEGTMTPVIRVSGLRAAGQLPMFPPNVAGWPDDTTWLGAATLVARYDLARSMATNIPTTNPAFVAARAFDLDALADAVGRPEGFTPATSAALAKLNGDPADVIALALASPDLSIA